jgi:hypothetical protein
MTESLALILIVAQSTTAAVQGPPTRHGVRLRQRAF